MDWIGEGLSNPFAYGVSILGSRNARRGTKISLDMMMC